MNQRLIQLGLLLVTLLILGRMASAQDSTSKLLDGELTYLLYVDVYSGYDFSKPYDGNRPPFIYQYNRDNEFNINMGVVDFNYKDEKLEANLGFNVGSFPQSYYSGKDTLLNMIYQANIKYLPSEKFDVAFGMYAPHLGFESILSYDNMTVSQSLVSEGTPYYISGVKAYYHPTKHWDLGLVFANGWQNLNKNPGARRNGAGLQAKYAVEDKVEVNYSNYTFNDSPDDKWTFYNELFIQKWFGEKWRVTAGGSYATIQDGDDVAMFTLISQYKINKRWAVAGRAEYVNDSDLNFYTSDKPTSPLKMAGFSSNLDWSATEKLKFRLEGRVFSASEDIFRDDQNYNVDDPNNVAYVSNNANILFSVQVKID